MARGNVETVSKLEGKEIVLQLLSWPIVVGDVCFPCHHQVGFPEEGIPRA